MLKPTFVSILMPSQELILIFQNMYQWFMIAVQKDLLPEVTMKFTTTKYYGECFFVQLIVNHSMFFRLDSRNVKHLDTSYHHLKYAIIQHPAMPKGKHHKLILLVSDHQNIATSNFEQYNTNAILKYTT